MKILGIDEAGRGPVCGPLVMCGYLIDSENVPQLRELGVKDSKLLSAGKREELFPQIRKIADDFMTLKIPVNEIDCININKLEIERMQHIINAFEADLVIIDAPEVNTQAFSKKVMSGVKRKTVINSENYADKNHVEVAAASVIAKVERDAEISRLHKEHGFFGSGYSHDEITIRFLKDWIKRNKEFPPFVRKSWFTARQMLADKEQSTVKKFIKTGYAK